MSNNKIKYQIFISSTYKDLKDERQAVVEAVLNSRNIPAGMELFNSSSKSQWEIIKQWINESDALILLLGSRYGAIDNEEKISYTEKEYNYAKSLEKPIYVFEINKINTNSNKDLEKLDEFKKKVKENRLIKMNIENTSELKNQVSQTLLQTLPNEIKEGGWVRVEECGKNVKKLKKIDAIQRDLDIYHFLKDDMYKTFMYVKTLYFQLTPYDICYIDDIENYLLNFEINPHKTFIKVNPNDYKNFLKHLKNILTLLKKGSKSLAHPNHFKLSFSEEDLKSLQKNYKSTLVDINGVYKHFYKECSKCIKSYNRFIQVINKYLYE
ncbi:DUF4062 domain-containing protein [Staphylococcus caprae]